MARGLAMSLAFALLASLPPVASAQPGAADRAAAPWRVLTGELTRADHEHYRELAFDLPSGVTRLTIRFSYRGREEHSVIDLGLFDPQRFRGWSGGARDRMTLSAEDATPGYLPGVLPAGRWRLVLGAPNIRPGARAPFEARLFIERAPGITEFADAPLVDRPGWYRGDLHMHSGNSDGSCAAQSGRKVPCPVYRVAEAAAARGLDFIGLSDHNTTAQYAALRALQPAFDRLLFVPAREITTFYGHANVFGPTAFLDFRMAAPTFAAARKWIDAANRVGAIVSPNHSGAPTGEICMGCGWQVRDLPPGSVAAVELVNGGTMAETGSAESPLQGFALWRSLLARGDHVTGIGGSDSHNPDTPASRPGAIGSPTTVVYARNLSVAALLDGIRAGRVFIDVDGTRDRILDLAARVGDARTDMGGTLRLAAGTPVELAPMIAGVERGSVEFIADDRIVDRQPLATGSAPHHLWRSEAGHHVLRATVRDEQGRLLLVSNPIYVEAAPTR